MVIVALNLFWLGKQTLTGLGLKISESVAICGGR